MSGSEHRTPSKRLPTGNDVVRRTCFPDRPEQLEEDILVERDGQLPLRFNGRLIGANVVDEDVPRGTLVRVFVTRAAKIVTSVRQWQRGRGAPRERNTAAVHETPELALAWLVEDGGGRLGSASCEAWRKACTAWPTFRDHGAEEID